MDLARNAGSRVLARTRRPDVCPACCPALARPLCQDNGVLEDGLLRDLLGWGRRGTGRRTEEGLLRQAQHQGPHSSQRNPAEPPHRRLQNQLFQAAGSQTRPTGPWPRAAAPRWEWPASRKERGTRGCTDTAPSQGRVGATREEKMELLIANRCGRPFSCFQGRLGRIFLATK